MLSGLTTYMVILTFFKGYTTEKNGFHLKLSVMTNTIMVLYGLYLIRKTICILPAGNQIFIPMQMKLFILNMMVYLGLLFRTSRKMIRFLRLIPR